MSYWQDMADGYIPHREQLPADADAVLRRMAAEDSLLELDYAALSLDELRAVVQAMFERMDELEEEQIRQDERLADLEARIAYLEAIIAPWSLE